MVTTDALERGRESFRGQRWTDAYTCLSAAGREGELPPEDLELLAVSSHLVGRYAEGLDSWTRAHNDYLRCGNVQRSARCAFWIAMLLVLQGELAQSGGWVARGRRILADGGLDCVETGYLLLPAALRLHWEGDTPAGHEMFAEALEIGERFAEPELVAFGRLGVGETLVRLGEVERGMALLDEVMASATTGELSVVAVGLIYCAVISCCHDAFDLRRAQEWTAALTRWCAGQPEAVPYQGECLVHRAQIMHIRGAWSDALEQAQKASERITGAGARPWAGAGFYELGDLHRLRGQFAEADEAYRQASVWGFAPQPGLALLRLAQGRLDAAAASIRTAMEQTPDALLRARLLNGHVEIMLARADLVDARASAYELRAIAEERNAPLLLGLSTQAEGAVLVAEGDAQAALGVLRRSWTIWQSLEAPYEAARVRVLIARACRALGDDDTADLELDSARQAFESLGARPDVVGVDELRPRPAAASPVGGLTAREVEVLRLVAAGKTNRAIADELVLSEKTVARHLSNIFAKLGISTRASATAYAYEHGLR